MLFKISKSKFTISFKAAVIKIILNIPFARKANYYLEIPYILYGILLLSREISEIFSSQIPFVLFQLSHAFLGSDSSLIFVKVVFPLYHTCGRNFEIFFKLLLKFSYLLFL